MENYMTIIIIEVAGGKNGWLWNYHFCRSFGDYMYFRCLLKRSGSLTHMFESKEVTCKERLVNPPTRFSSAVNEEILKVNTFVSRKNIVCPHKNSLLVIFYPVSLPKIRYVHVIRSFDHFTVKRKIFFSIFVCLFV